MGKGSPMTVIAHVHSTWPDAPTKKVHLAFCESRIDDKVCELIVGSNQTAWFTLAEVKSLRDQLHEWLATAKDNAQHG